MKLLNYRLSEEKKNFAWNFATQKLNSKIYPIPSPGKLPHPPPLHGRAEKETLHR